MTHRVLIEFVVDVPNEGVLRDVETRLTTEHGEHLFGVLTSVMGHEPLRAPGHPGMVVMTEPVHWDKREEEWVGEGDEDDE